MNLPAGRLVLNIELRSFLLRYSTFDIGCSILKTP